MLVGSMRRVGGAGLQQPYALHLSSLTYDQCALTQLLHKAEDYVIIPQTVPFNHLMRGGDSNQTC